MAIGTPGLGQDLNPGLSEYKAKLVPAWQPLSVIYSVEEFDLCWFKFDSFMSYYAHLHSEVQFDTKHFTSSMTLGFLGTPNKKPLCSQWNLTRRTEQEIKM